MIRFFTTLCTLLIASSALAVDPPGVISHQGRIAIDNTNYDGAGFFKFALVDASASSTFWTNDGTPSGEPAASVQIPVTKGHYTAVLGDAPMVTIPASIFTDNADVRLRIWFATSNGGPYLMLAPDRRLTSVGYALNAKSAGGVTPSYATGGSNELALQSINNTTGELTFDVTFPEAFLEAPTIAIPGGWTLGSVTETGFTATAPVASRAVDSAGVVGAHTSIASIGGRPAISYRDLAGSSLKFARAGDSAGETWPASSIVDVDGAFTDSGEYTSLAEVAGRPAISYYHGATGDLRFVRSEDAEGASWPGATTVDGATENVGWHTSLAVIGGVPAISYYAPNAGELRYAWAADPEGAVWPAANIAAVDGAGAPDMGRYSSLIEVAGKPAIAYYSATGSDLRYAYLTGTDPGVPGDWTKVSVDASDAVGEYASLAIVGGNPAISYFDATNGNLKFVRASNATGTSWAGALTVDGAPAISGAYSSLAVFGGRPAISYFDETNRDLKFIVAADTNGTSWPAANGLTIDGSSADMGSYSSMAAVNGVPAIAFHEAAGNFDLRFASLPLASWSASSGDALPVLASGVKEGAITAQMLSSEIGVWQRDGTSIQYGPGKVGIGRQAASNALEVEGLASKTTAGSWLANSDRRIKTDVRELEGALEVINRLRPVAFRYTDAFRTAHPSVGDREYLNVIAQEFREVFPDDVKESGEKLSNGEPILQVDTYPATIYSIAAIQELHEKLQEKDAEIDALKARLEAIERRLGQ